MNYGYQDSKEVGPGKSGGEFGLNSGVFVTKFEFNPTAGKDGAALEAIDLHVQIEERTFNRRFFPIGKVFKDGNEITDTNSEDYKKEVAKQNKLLTAALTDIVSCFVSQEVLKDALAVPIASFKDYAEILQRLVTSLPDWNKIPVDLFLEYQYSPKGENTRTFLQIPASVKHGAYITRGLGEGYVEDRTATHLKYVNEEGVEHPFKRGKWYVNNGFSKLTDLGETSALAPSPTDSGGTDW